MAQSGLFASSENTIQSASCDRLSKPPNYEITLSDHSVDYRSSISTSLPPEAIRLNGFRQSISRGVVVFGIYESDYETDVSADVFGVDAGINGGASKLKGQMAVIRANSGENCEIPR